MYVVPDTRTGAEALAVSPKAVAKVKAAVNMLGIDVWCSDAAAAYRRLSKLKTTVAIQEPSPYRHCRDYSRMFIDTTMTERQLSDWLYKARMDAGVFVRKNYYKKDGFLWDQLDAVPLSEAGTCQTSAQP